MKNIVMLWALMLFLGTGSLNAQTKNRGVFKGVIVDAQTNKPLPFAAVQIADTTDGAITDDEGLFTIENIKPGYHAIKVTLLGYKTFISKTLLVTNARSTYLQVSLSPSVVDIDEVKVRPSAFKEKVEAPIAFRSIPIEEIERNPGGNRDISKVIQSYPGVGSSVSFRNDLIVRGGGPAENRFFLDGVEIPTINHFTTQGASGGPTGILNVDFIREVNFYSGSYPTNFGMPLSSVLSFEQKDGNTDKMKFRATVGASDLALTADGPIGEKTTMVVSARRSYLQFLFQLLDLPFLPTYNDVQFKIKHKFDSKNELTFIGIGAYDDLVLNEDANETEEQRYILGNIPTNNQWSYTLGAVYKHFYDKGYHALILSNDRLDNSAEKFKDNVETVDNLNLNYNSYEMNTRFRYENHFYHENFKAVSGVSVQNVQYYNKTFQREYLGDEVVDYQYKTNLDYWKFGLFTQLTQAFFDQRLDLSLGLRIDGSSYASYMNNPFKQFAPRLSAKYNFTDKLSLNGYGARLYQLPVNTTLGYKDLEGNLVNKDNEITFISSDQFGLGVVLRPRENTVFSVEGFYKQYDKYPYSVQDSISTASQGGDFGVVGTEEVTSTSKGRAYGMEALYRNSDLRGFNVTASYTFFYSEFQDYRHQYIPSSWDVRHILALTVLKNLPKNWSIGARYRFQGGSPYTPYNEPKSSLKEAWDVQGQGYLDYAAFNTERLGSFSQLDLRVDKAWYYDKWTLMFYIDIQNVLAAATDTPDVLVQQFDENGTPLTDPNDPSRYDLKYLDTSSGNMIPTIGIMVEF
ncbi:TonB-dependent receptor [Halosquirtibacter xylanolyticus]|uniref:TonB-dependent receptor n=1 Tax=Halosquirtibacter xylanolyticus TaxID=3374599 RepID=UPI003749300D|nr:TonB-dependent receptor [Prolixibacteraceae bacterium]